MRVLLLAERYRPQPGGVAVAAERNARNLAPALERLEVLHLVDHLPPGASETRQEEGFLVHSLGRAAREEDSLGLLEMAALGLARRMEAQILHGFYARSAGFVATLAARQMGVPSVVSLRGNDLDRGVFERTGMLHWTLAHSDRILVVSRALGLKVAAFASRQDAVFTPNSVDGNLFRPVCAAPDLGPEQVVLFSGEMRFKKGLLPLLDAAARLAPKPVRLVLAGGVRREAREAFRVFRQAHPEARVFERPHTGNPEELAALYCRADLVVLPALWEGMPNALLEAMACARPVLATAVGGIRDLVVDSTTGWLFPPEELHLLDQHILRALAEPSSAREALGRAAREHVLADFTPQAERDRLLDVYRGLIRR